jgi:hypothetical protein
MNGPRFDVEAWVRSRFVVRNADGGGGYDRGFLKVDCPFCDDSAGHGWVNVLMGWMKCWRPGCPASEGLEIVEAVRRVEGFTTQTEARLFLRREFPATGLDPLPPKPPAAYDDWCRLPKEFRPIPKSGSPYWTRTGGSMLLDEAVAFARKQWGVGPATLARHGAGYCWSGRHAWRLILPVVMGGAVVAFQGRSYRGGEPKYRTSKWGSWDDRDAECGRPAEALLFNLDQVTEGCDVTLVEGPGDAMRQTADAARGDSGEKPREDVGGRPALVGRDSVAVALLGTALTDEKAALLAAKAPGRVIVAMDAEPEAEARGRRHVEVLRAWGVEADLGRWVGGKDAGEGAALVRTRRPGLTGLVLGRLGR